MRTTEISILLVYMVVCIGIGLYSRAKSAKGSSKDFLTAGESLGTWVSGMAMFAALATGGTMLGNMGVSYSMGWGYIMTIICGVVVGFMLVSLFMAKPFRNLKIATVPEFFKIRYDSALLRILVPLILIVSITAYIIAQMKVAGMIGETILGIPYNYAVITMGLVYVFYTAIGGMWAVTITDVFQGSLMLFISLVAWGIVVDFGGGLTELYNAAQQIKPDWSLSFTLPISSYVGAFLIWVAVIAVLPHTVMRDFAAREERVAKKALALSTFLYILVSIGTLVYISAAAVLITKGEKLPNADAAFLNVIETLFPSWLKGITFAAIFAAVMSSVSAMLLSVAAAISYDLVKVLRPQSPDASIKRLNSSCVGIIGLVVIVFALNPPELMTLLYSAAMGLFASGLFWPTLLGILWKRMNKYGAIASVVGGSAVYLYCLFGVKLPALSQICYSLPISLVLSVGVSMLTAPPSAKEMHRISIAHQREYDPEKDASSAGEL
jgi:sodium/pantothenate symporter